MNFVALAPGWTKDDILEQCNIMEPKINSVILKAQKKSLKEIRRKFYNDFHHSQNRLIRLFLCPFCHTVFQGLEIRQAHARICPDKENCLEDAKKNNNTDLLNALKLFSDEIEICDDAVRK